MENEEKKTIGTKKIKDFVFAVGRRREAVARIRVYSKVPDSLKFGEYAVKKGDLAVNGKNITEYFSGAVSKATYEKPLKLLSTINKYTITAKVEGGGLHAQLDAWVLGVSRALSIIDETARPILRKKGLLTRSEIKQIVQKCSEKNKNPNINSPD